MSYLRPIDPTTGKPLPVEQWDADTKRTIASAIADSQRLNQQSARGLDYAAIKFGRSLFPQEFEALPSDDDCDKKLKAK